VTLRKLEKYEIEEELGHGGMATVFRARDTRLDRAVAVKVMHPHLRGAAEARARFTREAKTVARLKHPNILEIYDYSGEDSPESYIATELLTGPTLKHFAEEHTEIPAEIAACFAIEIARALAVAHANGIVHRDVKPENVLLHENRGLKLTDFGIAQMVDAQSMTATGQVLGSPGHMAPEQVEGKDCDGRTDLFSLGTVLYYLATGRLPFTGRNPHAILKKIMDGDYADPLRIRPTIGVRLRAIIQKLLQRDPALRYADAVALEKDLVAFVAEIGIDDPSAQLVAYLADPSGVTAALRLRAIEKLTALGEAELDHDEMHAATQHLDRVLALDDGNARVLSLLARVSRRARARKVAFFGTCALLALAGIAMGGYALSISPPSGSRRVEAHADAAPTIVNEPRDAGVPVAVVTQDAGSAGASPSAPDGGSVPISVSARFSHVNVESVVATERRVLFAPTPVDVTIAVDGRPPRPFGPSYAGETLSVGRHSFVFANEGCCVEERFDLNVPAGAEPLRVARTLRYKPAQLMVRAVGVDDAQVAIDGVPRGVAWGLIAVPVTSLAPHVRITVTAEGHRAYTGDVQLEAGKTTEVTATLGPAVNGP
jgi:serine/threonine-protein kinase